MAKRKITVTVDEGLVEETQRLQPANLSAVVNAALAEHLDRIARHEALGDLLSEWDARFGSVDEEAAADARAAFDELDATVRRTA